MKTKIKAKFLSLLADFPREESFHFPFSIAQHNWSHDAPSWPPDEPGAVAGGSFSTLCIRSPPCQPHTCDRDAPPECSLGQAIRRTLQPKVGGRRLARKAEIIMINISEWRVHSPRKHCCPQRLGQFAASKGASKGIQTPSDGQSEPAGRSLEHTSQREAAASKTVLRPHDAWPSISARRPPARSAARQVSPRGRLFARNHVRPAAPCQSGLPATLAARPSPSKGIQTPLDRA